ncbi:MAG: Ig-like domain-containing protein [Actinomycetota bacterium]|nr:Ig-like domain-containing protein [Actinomycetota bacterium]
MKRTRGGARKRLISVLLSICLILPYIPCGVASAHGGGHPHDGHPPHEHQGHPPHDHHGSCCEPPEDAIILNIETPDGSGQVNFTCLNPITHKFEIIDDPYAVKVTVKSPCDYDLAVKANGDLTNTLCSSTIPIENLYWKLKEGDEWVPFSTEQHLIMDSDCTNSNDAFYFDYRMFSSENGVSWEIKAGGYETTVVYTVFPCAENNHCDDGCGNVNHSPGGQNGKAHQNVNHENQINEQSDEHGHNGEHYPEHPQGHGGHQHQNDSDVQNDGRAEAGYHGEHGHGGNAMSHDSNQGDGNQDTTHRDQSHSNVAPNESLNQDQETPGQDLSPSEDMDASESSLPEDTTPPQVVFITAGGEVEGTIPIKIAAIDDTGIEQVKLFIDDAEMGDVPLNEEESMYIHDWDTTTTQDGEHTLVVKAYDQAGNEAVSDPLTLTTNNPPSSPRNLIATSKEDGINLTWSPNPETDIAGYNIYRATFQDGPFEKINQELVTSTSFKDTGINLDDSYYYFIKAVDETGKESEASQTVWIPAIAQSESIVPEPKE